MKGDNRADLAELWFTACHRLYRDLQKGWRDGAELNVAAMAEFTGLSAQEIEDTVRGKKSPNIRRVSDIARAMGMRLVMRLEPLPTEHDCAGASMYSTTGE